MFRLIKAFCQPPISANFGCCYCISFDIACKELKITKIVQNDLFSPQLLTLVVLTVTSSLGYLYVSGKKQLSRESTCLQFCYVCCARVIVIGLQCHLSMRCNLFCQRKQSKISCIEEEIFDKVMLIYLTDNFTSPLCHIERQ